MICPRRFFPSLIPFGMREFQDDGRHPSGKTDAMKIVTARVMDGRIEVPPEIGDGSQVAILASDEGEAVHLSPQDEAELGEALAEIHAGQYTDGWALLEALKAKR